MAVVGIDLGTTYSVIATPQKFEGEYFEEVKGVTLIKDDHKRRITPSVVAIDQQGNILVGHRAKGRAGQRPDPIMFVKRSMGENKIFELDDKQLQPEDVSAEILRYLKELAEKQMGEKIDEAVITVPAYFTMLQKQKTKEAGEKAGLIVSEIMQEPVAAALMYCQDDERDLLTILTYDLGGGTFDVAILRKEKGEFKIKAFDGDRYLGGYNFDKNLAFLIIDQLNKSNYNIEIKPDNIEHQVILSKLLVIAEMAKIKLSTYETYSLVEPNTGIIDANGEPVSIDLEVTRENFIELIKDDIEETMRLCHRALEKTDPTITIDQIDEIIMVGGSSRIPYVSKRLETEFGIRPRLIDPDLCVGIGAAIMAKRLGRRIGSLKLGFIPEVTSLSTVQITGFLEQSEQTPTVTDYSIVIIPADGSMPQRTRVTESGGFIFPQVPLAPDTTNIFVLRVEDKTGGEIITHSFSIKRQATAAERQVLEGPAQPNVLAKPIAIMTVTGLHTVAQERTPLPYECHISAQTEDQKGQVRIPVYEDTYQIGEIIIDAVPTDLPIGSKVEVTLNLRSDFYIEGKANVPAARVEGKTTIQLPPMEVKSLADLQNSYIDLSRKANEALAQADRGQAFGIAPRLKAVLNRCQKLLYEEREPNPARAQELLAEVEALIQQLSGWQPDPPAEQFEQVKDEIKQELLPELYDLKPLAPDGHYEGQLNAILQRGEKALHDKDATNWAQANRQLNDLRDKILTAIEKEQKKRQRGQVGAKTGKGGPEEKPDPRAIKLKLAMDLTQLREQARRKGRIQELEKDFTECDESLKKINPDAFNAMMLLLEYYENYHQPLQAKVTGRVAGTGGLPDGLVRALEGQKIRK